MLNTCHSCGEYHADKAIDPSGPFAICQSCGKKQVFRRMPLLCLTGASGTGKSTVCAALAYRTQDVVVMASDILWRPEFGTSETNLRDYRNMWLRISKNISQAGRPVMLCGSFNPGQFEECVEARYFSKIHYLTLLCDDETLARRLRGRPSWRNSGSDEFIQTHQDWNRWFRDSQHEQDVTLMDTTDVPVAVTVDQVEQWLAEKLRGAVPG